jgi:chromosome partitioning protein
VAAQAHAEGFKTLLIDVDQQFSAGLHWGLSAEELLALDERHMTLLYALLEQRDQRVPLSKMTVKKPGRPDFVPASGRLGRAPELLQLSAERALKRALMTPWEGVSAVDDYDVVILDTPGNVGCMVTNALVAATHVLVPVQPQHLAFAACQETMRSILQVQDVINYELQVLGFAPTMVTNQTHDRLVLDALAKMAASYNVPVFPAIPLAAAYKKATTICAPVMEFAPGTKGIEAFQAIVAQLMRGGA